MIISNYSKTIVVENLNTIENPTKTAIFNKSLIEEIALSADESFIYVILNTGRRYEFSYTNVTIPSTNSNTALLVLLNNYLNS
jgi:hypothetical protein